MREGTRCDFMVYFRLTVRDFLYVVSHREDSTYHGFFSFFYISCEALARF